MKQIGARALPFPGTKQWQKEFKKALQSPNFKFKKPVKAIEVFYGTPTERRDMKIARTCIDELED